MTDLQNDTLATQGFKHWKSFAEADDLARAQKQLLEFYNNALKNGLFRSKSECQELGLLKNFSSYENKGDAPTSQTKRAASNFSVTSDKNIVLNEMSWFFETKTYRKLVDYIVPFAGPDLDMFMSKIIMTLPLHVLPDYVRETVLPMEKTNVGFLSPFIKPEYLKVFFFAHNPWHQDTVDYPESDFNFYTTLIALTDRSGGQAPLLVIPESSKIGKISHPIVCAHENGEFVYTWKGKEYRWPIMQVNSVAGDLTAWHSYTFHQVMPCESEMPGISLRFNFAPSYRKTGLYDTKNIRVAHRSPLTKMTEAQA